MVGGVGVVVYICIYVYNALVACVVVVWWWSARVYMDRYIYIYNGGLLVFCTCVYLSVDKLLPKIKHFSRLNTVYMQKSAENRIFLYGYMQNDLENQNPKSRLHCAICIYHLEN